MSDILQLGQHPDADQINAFLENALPAHEREQMLVHLAGCFDCRGIVAMSLPAGDESGVAEPAPAVAPPFGGWFSGWKLAWIAAPALAAMVVLTFFLRDKSTERRAAVRPTQIADAHPPPLVSQDNEQLAKKIPPSSDSSSEGGAAKIRKPSASRTEPVTTAPLLNGRSSAAVAMPVPPGAAIGGPIAARGAMAGAAVGMSAAPARKSPDFREPSPAAVSPVARAAEIRSSSAPAPSMAVVPTPNSNFADSSAGIPATSAGARGRSLAATSSLMKNTLVTTFAPLPSGLPILSAAAHIHQIVALDTHNAIFYSEDEGRRWKAVVPRWQGRAIAVATNSPGLPVSHPRSFAVPERFAGGAFASANLSTQPDAAGSSLGGIVTDASGAAVSGAEIAVKESRYAVVRTEKTDATGHYLFANLAPGSYRIDAQSPGFAKQSLIENIASSQQAVRNLVLAVGQSAQTVTVDAASVQLETQSRSTDDLPGVLTDKAKNVTTQSLVTEGTPVFVITLESGDSWTSSDGQNWKHE